jgi:hypothetical protein
VPTNSRGDDVSSRSVPTKIEGIDVSSRSVPTNKRGDNVSSRLVPTKICNSIQIYKRKFLWFSPERVST